MEANFPYIKLSCTCCRSCFVNVATGECIYGGPFVGYKNAEGYSIKLEPLDEIHKN